MNTATIIQKLQEVEQYQDPNQCMKHVIELLVSNIKDKTKQISFQAIPEGTKNYIITYLKNQDLAVTKYTFTGEG